MKFFIVDDDPDTLALVSRLLTDAGHEVTVRASSTGALRDIPELLPDCVITDVMMPVMDGFELTRELRAKAELAKLKILILSAKSYDFDRRRALPRAHLHLAHALGPHQHGALLRADVRARQPGRDPRPLPG